MSRASPAWRLRPSLLIGSHAELQSHAGTTRMAIRKNAGAAPIALRAAITERLPQAADLRASEKI
jgi:hypothetical protein